MKSYFFNFNFLVCLLLQKTSTFLQFKVISFKNFKQNISFSLNKEEPNNVFYSRLFYITSLIYLFLNYKFYVKLSIFFLYLNKKIIIKKLIKLILIPYLIKFFLKS